MFCSVRLGRLASIAAAISGAVACLNPPSAEERIAQRIVVTKFDPSVDFTSFSTFAMPDSIVVVSSVGFIDSGVGPTTVDPSVAGPTLEEIATQLTDRGYRRVSRSERPDLGVSVIGLNQLRGFSVPYGAWWGIGSASPAFWSEPSSTVAANFTYQTVAWQSGTLIIELLDVRDAGEGAVAATPEAGSHLNVVWAGIIHGIVGAPGATLEAPPIEPIRQAFAQSPYLATAPPTASVTGERTTR